jgi:Na+/melibiose symporter-like transporter
VSLAAPSGLWRYGLLGLPLAFVALPLYVVLPHHYASTYGMPLTLLGGVLLAARLLDALLDPWIGRWLDGRFARSPRSVLAWGVVAAVVLALGMAGLFFPPLRTGDGLAVWATLTLALTCIAFSVLTVAHQAWGARLGGGDAEQSRVVGWREGLGVPGVLLASVLPSVAGLPATLAVFAVLLVAGCLAWRLGPWPAGGPAGAQAGPALSGATTVATSQPLSRPAFRRLLAVFMLNGIASAVPATLVLFFIQDRLQAPKSWEPLFLGLYFLCAAVSLPAWLALVRRLGLARTWLIGMGLAIAAFLWTAGLGAGDAAAFLIVCAASGLALGADLALPGALLAGVIAREGDRGQREGAYFGWWNLAAKLNLALAAGLALPLLSLAGYVPGTRDEAGLQSLTLAYGLLPCGLKLLAALALYLTLIRPRETP